jgi:methionyl-tRNA synthetase
VYWPAFLMSAGLPLPKQIFGHGFILARGGEKMSKSLGNVVDPIELAERFGVDALRYFLLREVSFGQDGSYSPVAIVTRCNAELANSFGNLAQRVLSMIAKNLDGELPELNWSEDDDDYLLHINVLAFSKTLLMADFERFSFDQGIQNWMQGVFWCNQYVDAQAPWALRKTDFGRMKIVLAALVRCIRDLAIAIQPIIPTSAGKLLDQLGIPEDERTFAHLNDDTWYDRLRASGHRIAPPTPIFPRLELPVEEG